MSHGNSPPLVANLWHLKATNGMFYFALDYLRALNRDLIVVTRASLAAKCRESLPGKTIVAVGAFGLFRIWFRSLFSNLAVFTPTPHPIPFLTRQIVVVHDSYPFMGKIGVLKRLLFRLSTGTSGCRIAYINNSESKRFAEECLAPETGRHLFLPNHVPVSTGFAGKRSRPEWQAVIVVGLVGTDSDKKNYLSLFEVIRSRELAKKFAFVAFGHDTTYFRKLCARYPDMNLRLVQSDTTSLDNFLAEVDCIVSIARHEGFGRPIAYAVNCGVPCFLVTAEVFLEFYDGVAVFAHDIQGLVSKMLNRENYIAPRAELPPERIRAGIETGVSIIDRL